MILLKTAWKKQIFFLALSIMDKNSKKLKDEYLAGWQRCKADLENYKKGEAERIGRAIDFVKSELLLSILNTFDNLEMAKDNAPKKSEQSEWVEGILQIQEQFYEFLKSEGIVEIKALGEKFDPNFHEAVVQIESGEKEPDIITEVLEKGYNLNGKVLRPAKVKVSK